VAEESRQGDIEEVVRPRLAPVVVCPMPLRSLARSAGVALRSGFCELCMTVRASETSWRGIRLKQRLMGSDQKANWISNGLKLLYRLLRFRSDVQNALKHGQEQVHHKGLLKACARKAPVKWLI